MQVLQVGPEKKNVAIGLLDIAIFLAMMGRIGFHRSPLIEDYGYNEGASDTFGPTVGVSQFPRFPHQLGGGFPRVKGLSVDTELTWRQYTTIMEDAQQRIPLGGVSEAFHAPNITAMMLSVGDTIANVETNNQSLLQPSEAVDFDIFSDLLNDSSQQGVVDLLADNDRPSESSFVNGEDVRWRDYLVEQNNKNNDTHDNHCDGETVECAITDETELDFDFDSVSSIESVGSESPSNTRTRTTSILSLESGIVVEPQPSISPTHDHTYSVDSPTLTSAASLQSNTDLDFLLPDQPPSTSHFYENNADLMHQVYLQDIDLGYNWPNAEAGKQLKDVDDLKKNDTDSASYIVDGETGEFIPIPQSNNTQHPQQGSTDSSQPSFFNIEEYLEQLEGPDGQQNNINQTNVIEGSGNPENLTSLLPQPGNNNIVVEPQQSEDIWDDIANLSELSGLSLPTDNNTNQVINNNLLSTRSEPLPENPNPTFVNQSHIDQHQIFNTSNTGYVACDRFDTNPSNVYDSQPLAVYPLGGVVSTQLAPNCSPAYSNVSTEEGMQMDPASRGSSPFSNRDMNENFLLNQLNNYQAAMDTTEPFSVGAGQNLTPPVLEPGQFFFNQNSSNNMNKALTDLLAMNSNLPAYDNNLNLPYLNPQQAPFLPPPLDGANAGMMSFVDDAENLTKTTLDAGALSESNESDSGISMGHSPQRFTFSSISEDSVFSTTTLKSESIVSEQDPMLCVDELRHIQHNHTYDGTVGAKNKTKKKLSKSPLPRESRDVRRARELNIPFTLDEIIMTPVEEYNEMLARTPLTQAQQTLVKDIRRRGKNKVAAQNCRKRKIETISSMEDDVEGLRLQKQRLLKEQGDLEAAKQKMKLQYNGLYQQIFSSLRDDSGLPIDASRFSLEQVEGAVLLMPRTASMHRNGSTQSGNANFAEQLDDAQVDFAKVKIEKGE